MKLLALLQIVAALLLASGTAAGTAPEPAKALDLVRPARLEMAVDFEVPTLDHGSLRLSGLRGKVVFVNFWATWCDPCREEMPAMERLQQRYRDRGLVVVALSVDAQVSRVDPFVRDRRFTFAVGLDGKMRVANLYRVRALPSTFIVDREGRLASVALGPREWDGPSAHALFDAMLSEAEMRP